MTQNTIGLIGLAVMGQNLALNLARNGYQVGVFNRTAEVTRRFCAGPAAGKDIHASFTFAELLASLHKPAIVLMMVKAGAAVDAVIEQLQPHLEPGDLVIDGGNSFYRDTDRRSRALAEQGINYLGVGISGGEEGALWGPSIMPGGRRAAYALVKPVFEAIAAKVNGDPCVTYIGSGGSGHFVKMVHNGIEYGLMQLIAEAYDLMRRGLGLSNSELGGVYKRWNNGRLASFLIEITAQILTHQDEETGLPLVEMILDLASQKGTGKWTSQEAFDLGVPVPTISTAVEARSLSAFKSEREQIAELYGDFHARFSEDKDEMINALEETLYASFVITYVQGMNLLAAASREYEYGLDLGEIARIWRGGCIIRAHLLEVIRSVCVDNPGLTNLLLAPEFTEILKDHQADWRRVVGTAAELGIPAPGMSSALAYFDNMRSSRLPANLIQAQRDFFGAHTYQRVDREGSFHTDWGK